MRALIPLGWTLWGVLLVVLLYGLLRVSTERTSSPEAGRALGVYTVLFLLALLAVGGALLRNAARKQSLAGLVAMALLLAYPLVMLIAQPLIRWRKDRSYASAAARVGNEPEIVRLLVDHGADIDHLQANGVPAIVRLIGNREWESALYLIEKGANLDVRNSDGLSVDYYLNDWKESVYGEHPEGWDRVREAIAKRRAAQK